MNPLIFCRWGILTWQIFTVECDARLAAISRENFSSYGCQDRIHVIEAQATDM